MSDQSLVVDESEVQPAGGLVVDPSEVQQPAPAEAPPPQASAASRFWEGVKAGTSGENLLNTQVDPQHPWSTNPLLPGAGVYRDIKAGNYAGAAGRVAGPAAELLPMLLGQVGKGAVPRPAPAWQTNPTPATEIPIQGSTPEEIQANLQRIASRPKPTAPAPRPAPAWQTNPAPATEIPIQGSTPEEIQANLQRMAGRPKPSGAPAPRPAPAWKTNPTPATEIPIQGSTPEEIQANLQRMATRPKPPQPTQTATPTPEPQPVPVGKFTKPQPNPPYTGPRVPQNMDLVDSTNITKMGYHPDSRTMFVEYRNGKVYEYRGVPQEIFEQAKGSESVGSYVAQNVKGRYETNYRGSVLSPGSKARQALLRK
jgi:hypothetical protein